MVSVAEFTPDKRPPAVSGRQLKNHWYSIGSVPSTSTEKA
jgi:hypothetical protein